MRPDIFGVRAFLRVYLLMFIVSMPVDLQRPCKHHIHFHRQQFNLFAFTNIWWNVHQVFELHCIPLDGRECDGDVAPFAITLYRPYYFWLQTFCPTYLAAKKIALLTLVCNTCSEKERSTGPATLATLLGERKKIAQPCSN